MPSLAQVQEEPQKTARQRPFCSNTAMAPTRKPTADGSQFVRLELDGDLAKGVMAAAEANERSLPGQIRVVLREWLAAKAS